MSRESDGSARAAARGLGISSRRALGLLTCFVAASFALVIGTAPVGGQGPSRGGPSPSSGGQSPSPSAQFTVQPGDTLGGIAQKCGTTASQLQLLNGAVRANSMPVGTVLQLPRPCSSGPTPSPTQGLSPTPDQVGVSPGLPGGAVASPSITPAFETPSPVDTSTPVVAAPIIETPSGSNLSLVVVIALAIVVLGGLGVAFFANRRRLAETSPFRQPAGHPVGDRGRRPSKSPGGNRETSYSPRGYPSPPAPQTPPTSYPSGGYAPPAPQTPPTSYPSGGYAPPAPQTPPTSYPCQGPLSSAHWRP
jgi:LysM repeat protein